MIKSSSLRIPTNLDWLGTLIWIWSPTIIGDGREVTELVGDPKGEPNDRRFSGLMPFWGFWKFFFLNKFENFIKFVKNSQLVSNPNVNHFVLNLVVVDLFGLKKAQEMSLW